ncbi:MAG TPA: hypothetical protein VIX80_05095, partial [Candidatus Kapabacteria bacterium]
TEPTVGIYDRGGIGKLGMMCVAIIKDETSTELEKVAPRPKPIVVTPKEWAEARRSAQLSNNKVNGLEGKSSDQLPVTSGQLGKGKKTNRRGAEVAKRTRNSGVGFRVSEREMVSV